MIVLGCALVVNPVGSARKILKNTAGLRKSVRRSEKSGRSGPTQEKARMLITPAAPMIVGNPPTTGTAGRRARNLVGGGAAAVVRR